MNIERRTVCKDVKGCSKNSEFKFLPIWVFSVSAVFRLFRCHFVKFYQSHSPLCSFFNLQKHTRKKNENQLDIIFRTSRKKNEQEGVSKNRHILLRMILSAHNMSGVNPSHYQIQLIPVCRLVEAVRELFE